MQISVNATNFGLLRKPLLSMQVFADWSNCADAEAFILEHFSDPLMEEGLYVSSRSLHARLLELRSNTSSDANEIIDRQGIVSSLAKFLSRAAYRCTPFGLFANVQFASAAEGDALAVGGLTHGAAQSLRRGIFLDSALETRLIEQALTDHDWRETLDWHISTAAVVVGDYLTYVDWQYKDDAYRAYRSVELELNNVLALLKERCQQPRTFGAICKEIAREIDVELDDAREFMHQIIDKRLLVPHLAPTANDECAIDFLLRKYPSIPTTSPLHDIRRQLHALREQATSSKSLIPEYQKLQSRIEAEFAAEPLTQSVVQVDSIDVAPAQFDPALAQRVAASVQLLMQCTGRRNTSMDSYKRLFRQRFDEREVNLAYAIHPELGIPFPVKGTLHSHLLEGIRFGDGNGAASDAVPLNAFDRLLIDRLFGALKDGGKVLRLAAGELAKINLASEGDYAMPEALSAQVGVLPGTSDQSPMLELLGFGGCTGIESFGRFCYLSEAISDAAARHYRELAEARPDAITAEVIHHPQDRALNVLRRPALATHEIAYCGISELPREKQLWIDDLTLQLSGERFILRDRLSGREVIPRLTSAHNFRDGQLGAYQLLGALQMDGIPWAGFTWPEAVANLPQLPRVEMDGIILSRERWKLDKTAIAALNEAVVAGTTTAWRLERDMPRFVTWDERDNRLPIDLHNAVLVNALLDEIIGLPDVTLHESIGLNEAYARGDFSHFNREWIVPLRVTAPDVACAIVPPTPSTRLHLHGEGTVHGGLDEWVYLRIYTGAGSADRVLQQAIKPVMLTALGQGELDRWFFIRYQDDFEHLRLRFHSTNRAALLSVLVAVQESLAQARSAGLLWKVVQDDYAPEGERYGGAAALTLCEQLFCADSEEFMALLDFEAQYACTAQRWLYSLASLDAYVRLVYPEAAEREGMLERLAVAYLKEQAPGKARSGALVSLGARYRELRSDLENLQGETGTVAAWLDVLKSHVSKRDSLIQAVRKEISHLHKAQQEGIWASLFHMHCNRLSASDPRRHETVLYDFARRLERARQARNGSVARPTGPAASVNARKQA